MQHSLQFPSLKGSNRFFDRFAEYKYSVTPVIPAELPNSIDHGDGAPGLGRTRSQILESLFRERVLQMFTMYAFVQISPHSQFNLLLGQDQETLQSTKSDIASWSSDTPSG